MKKTSKRLALRGETVRQLTRNLGSVRGGQGTHMCPPISLETCDCPDTGPSGTTAGPLTTYTALTCRCVPQ